MNRKNPSGNSITQPILDRVTKLHQAALKAVMPKPAAAPQMAPSKQKAAELDQDAGGRYNPNHTYPQV